MEKKNKKRKEQEEEEEEKEEEEEEEEEEKEKEKEEEEEEEEEEEKEDYDNTFVASKCVILARSMESGSGAVADKATTSEKLEDSSEQEWLNTRQRCAEMTPVLKLRLIQ
nr:unnamed protein product [Spirometra erinaceieuropaei]